MSLISRLARSTPLVGGAQISLLLGLYAPPQRQQSALRRGYSCVASVHLLLGSVKVELVSTQTCSPPGLKRGAILFLIFCSGLNGRLRPWNTFWLGVGHTLSRSPSRSPTSSALRFLVSSALSRFSSIRRCCSSVKKKLKKNKNKKKY